MSDRIYLPPSLQFRARHLAMSTWIDHLPFAYDLVADRKPELLVELGTYSGLSFFSFCQAMEENKVRGLAYAVDTWEGDEHTGNYDDSVYQQVASHARENYPGFSYLLRMRFDEALAQFDDRSIDILHIDGLHTYEAVKQDFESWLPRVKDDGIILLHDIEARLPEFGVRRFWQEISSQYPSFEFRHGYGLGVLKKSAADFSPLEELLFAGDAESAERLRQFYMHVAFHHHSRRLADKASS